MKFYLYDSFSFKRTSMISSTIRLILINLCRSSMTFPRPLKVPNSITLRESLSPDSNINPCFSEYFKIVWSSCPVRPISRHKEYRSRFANPFHYAHYGHFHPTRSFIISSNRKRPLLLQPEIVWRKSNAASKSSVVSVG